MQDLMETLILPYLKPVFNSLRSLSLIAIKDKVFKSDINLIGQLCGKGRNLTNEKPWHYMENADSAHFY